MTSAVIFIAEGSEDGVEADMREELAHVVDVFQNPELFANGLPLLGSPENDAAEQRGEVIETTIEAEATAEEHRRRELHAKLMEEPHISGGRDSEGYCGAENGGC